MTACVGIVGGLGVGATVHYYEKITSACKARGMVPDLVFMHADAIPRGPIPTMPPACAASPPICSGATASMRSCSPAPISP